MAEIAINRAPFLGAARAPITFLGLTPRRAGS
jgi:hypothetical protein